MAPKRLCVFSSSFSVDQQERSSRNMKRTGVRRDAKAKPHNVPELRATHIPSISVAYHTGMIFCRFLQSWIHSFLDVSPLKREQRYVGTSFHEPSKPVPPASNDHRDSDPSTDFSALPFPASEISDPGAVPAYNTDAPPTEDSTRIRQVRPFVYPLSHPNHFLRPSPTWTISSSTNAPFSTDCYHSTSTQTLARPAAAAFQRVHDQWLAKTAFKATCGALSAG